MESEPQPHAILVEIASRLFAINTNMLYLKDSLDRFSAAFADPDGEIRAAMHDVLETYGQLTQFREIAGNQRDQTQALAAAMGVYLSHMLAHDRRGIDQHDAILEMLHAFASGTDPAEIALAAQTARDVLAHEAEAQAHARELAEAEARALLRVARIDERGKIAAAANAAEKEIAAAEAGAISAVSDAAGEAQIVIADAAGEARDELAHEKDEASE